jgi:hypothetical protein
MGVRGQRHSPTYLPPRKTRYLLYRRLGGLHGRSGRMRKISPPTGIRSPYSPARNESLYRLSHPSPLTHSERNIKSCVNKKIQLDATVRRHLFTAKSLYMFRASQRPSSGVLKNLTATSGIGHNTGAATSFQRGLIRTLVPRNM